MTAQQKAKTKINEYDKALAEYNQAMKYFHNGDFEKAKESLSSIGKDYPKERELVDRTNLYLQICENRLNPPKDTLKTGADFFQNGIFLMNQGRYDEAIESLKKAHSKNPKDAKALYTMADASCLKGDLDLCLDFLKQAVGLDPFFAVLAQNEVDFESVREDSRFLEITTTE